MTLRGRFSIEKPPPLVKLIPVMAPYDAGDVPAFEEDGTAALPKRVFRRGRGVDDGVSLPVHGGPEDGRDKWLAAARCPAGQ